MLLLLMLLLLLVLLLLESVFRGSERRSDLEKWYAALVAEAVSAVGRIAR